VVQDEDIEVETLEEALEVEDDIEEIQIEEVLEEVQVEDDTEETEVLVLVHLLQEVLEEADIKKKQKSNNFKLLLF